ncbi:hypothetical protein [Pigmentiphaga kullae]|uniref:Uncharacterized protein n=1 Tax=Pigmentiphaga kullae TaxID=151784 RepID=A0A4Q7NHB7_9BURK|nr:hypothetical protein [Pigmentiphaga kullae]RZS84269.1 hypothetical protein EV675_0284 [Pigmentiphaga kullae]
MDQSAFRVAWMRASEEGPDLVEAGGLTLVAAVEKAHEVGDQPDFLAGQILDVDGFVLANFARNTIQFNRDPRG